jgi:hypothetical protein
MKSLLSFVLLLALCVTSLASDQEDRAANVAKYLGGGFVVDGAEGAVFVFSPNGEKVIPDSFSTMEPGLHFWNPNWTDKRKMLAFPVLVRAVQGSLLSAAQIKKLLRLFDDSRNFEKDSPEDYIIGRHDVGVLLLSGGSLRIIAFANECGCVDVSGVSPGLILSRPGSWRFRAWLRAAGIHSNAL